MALKWPVVPKHSDVMVLGDFNHDVLKRENIIFKFLED
jgi:hypothetical protein